jgi:diadenosine tetraphosphatase ApaH/serine/threonine PP2A family protein phosphatase
VNWTRSELSERNLDWLRELPKGPLYDEDWTGIQFVHGSPVDEDTYIHSEFSVSAALVVSELHITFFGHTHVQGAFGRPHGTVEALAPERLNNASNARISRLELDPVTRYLVNPGSVGQPRDHDRRAAFALYDSDENEVLFYRVPYDIAAAQERILQAGLPKGLALRLEDGR